jgi:hypothetical protein
MAFCESKDIDYVFGLPANAVLLAAVEDAADDVRVRRADKVPVLRRYADSRYRRKSWPCQSRVVARIEAGTRSLDIRLVLTSLVLQLRLRAMPCLWREAGHVFGW